MCWLTQWSLTSHPTAGRGGGGVGSSATMRHTHTHTHTYWNEECCRGFLLSSVVTSNEVKQADCSNKGLLGLNRHKVLCLKLCGGKWSFAFVPLSVSASSSPSTAVPSLVASISVFPLSFFPFSTWCFISICFCFFSFPVIVLQCNQRAQIK